MPKQTEPRKSWQHTMDRSSSINRETMRYFMGYLIGGSLFLILIPLGIYRVSQLFDNLFEIHLIPWHSLRVTISIIFLVSGLLFTFWSIIAQYRFGKGGPLVAANIALSPKTQHLVVTGPYKYTRNPMLFGTCIYYFALALYLNSLSAIASVVIFMIFMLLFVKIIEEPRLRSEFGKEYDNYYQRVSMFIPWKQKV